MRLGNGIFVFLGGHAALMQRPQMALPRLQGPTLLQALVGPSAVAVIHPSRLRRFHFQLHRQPAVRHLLLPSSSCMLLATGRWC
jgi:hypothetical protein